MFDIIAFLLHYRYIHSNFRLQYVNVRFRVTFDGEISPYLEAERIINDKPYSACFSTISHWNLKS